MKVLKRLNILLQEDVLATYKLDHMSTVVLSVETDAYGIEYYLVRVVDIDTNNILQKERFYVKQLAVDKFKEFTKGY